MRSTIFFFGMAAAALAGGTIAVGCSSSSSGGNNNTADAATEAAASCQALSDASIATGDFNNSFWTCLQSACASDLVTCQNDCDCNNSALTSLNCAEDASAAALTGCFTTLKGSLGANAANVNAGAVLNCLGDNLKTCGIVLPGDAGTDGGDAGSATPTDAGDAGSETTPDAGDAGSETTPDAGDAGDGGPAT